MNNRRFILLMCFVLLTSIQISFAQAGGKIHILKKGETLSVLATKYNTTVGDIMRLNSMHQDTKLAAGQKIKIPQGQVAAITNATQTTAKSTSIKPVITNAPKQQTHVVKQGETLFAISKMYSVTVDQIKALNNLTSDNVNEGQQLVINSNATVIAKVNKAAAAQNPIKEPTNKPVVTEQQPMQTNQPADTAAQQSVTHDTSKAYPSNHMNEASVNTAPVQPVSENTTNKTVDPLMVGAEGYFASLFGVDVQQRSLKTIEGASMTFKTASGWADKKYYILMNDVPPGSIVKVVANSKTIYAKVLWNLGEMKENEGLTFRISNAASAALSIADQKFNISVTYYE